MTWTPPSTLCVRAAWLTLGALTVGLEGPGYFCSSLDLGYPDVRDVVDNNPDRDGVTDRTALMGGRVVSADITALRGAGARIDAVASSFAPFMAPAARPTLHYILDRPGAAERTLTLRASGYSWPVAGADQRDINLQWLAADPVARDPAEQSVTAWSGSSTVAGRTYPLVHNRIYPPGGGGSTTAQILTGGDLPVRPHLRIYGPITAPGVTITQYVAAFGTATVYFVSTFTLGAGAFVDIDTSRKTAWLNNDPNQSAVALIDWQRTTWPVVYPVPPATFAALMTLTGTSTSGVTQVQATWHDGYLT